MMLIFNGMKLVKVMVLLVTEDSKLFFGLYFLAPFVFLVPTSYMEELQVSTISFNMQSFKFNDLQC